MMQEFIRPNLRKMSIVENNHLVDFYYPTVYSTKLMRRVFLSVDGVVVRKSTSSDARGYSRDFCNAAGIKELEAERARLKSEIERLREKNWQIIKQAIDKGSSLP